MSNNFLVCLFFCLIPLITFSVYDESFLFFPLWYRAIESLQLTIKKKCIYRSSYWNLRYLNEVMCFHHHWSDLILETGSKQSLNSESTIPCLTTRTLYIQWIGYILWDLYYFVLKMLLIEEEISFCFSC